MVKILTKKNISDLNISTRLLAERALERGYQLQYFEPSLETETGIIKCSKGKIEFQFKSTSTCLTPSYGYFSAEDKILTHNLLSGHDVPTPVTYEVNIESIPSNLNFSKKSYVVKPVAMNHGDGVTVGVDSNPKLKKAVSHALNMSKSATAIIQEQVYGKEYRFLVIADEVFAVAGREPPHVIGNGTSNIQELINSINKDPRRGIGHKAILTKVILTT
jgi:D-alanine-D-alanine ligase-like ATP-grasp enzyme